MSYYKLGLTVDRSSTLQLTPYQRGMQTGEIVGILPGYVSTGETLLEMKLLEREIAATAGEISNLMIANPSAELRKFASSWNAFQDRWNRFFADNVAWWDRFTDTNEVFTRTQDFRKEYIEYREIGAKKYGIKWGSPQPRAPLDPPGGMLDNLSKKIEGLLWTIVKFSLIGGAVFLLFLFISKKIGR